MNLRTSAYLRGQAMKCRELAEVVDDVTARSNLLQLANEYEAEAGGMERRVTAYETQLALAS